MDRRTVLRRGLPVALVALAGCTGDGGGDGSGDGDGNGGYGGGAGTDEPTDTSTRTTSPDPDDGAETRTPTPTATGTDATGRTATATPTASPSPTATPTPTATGTPTPEPDQRVTVAPGGEFRFDPETFAIERGDTVLWVWDGSGHNVSDGTQPADADWSGDDETTYGSGHAYAYTFEVAGEYEYHCDPHRSLGMVGSFTVE